MQRCAVLSTRMPNLNLWQSSRCVRTKNGSMSASICLDSWQLNGISIRCQISIYHVWAQVSDVEIMGPKPRPGRDRDRRKVCLMGAFLAHRPLCDSHTPSSVFPSYFKSLWWLDIMTVGAIPPPSSCFFPEVTVFQLEKMFGKSQEAKEFIAELCRGHLDKPKRPCWFVLICDAIFHWQCLVADPIIPPYKSRWILGQQGVPHPQAWCGLCLMLRLSRLHSFVCCGLGRPRRARKPECSKSCGR